MNVSEVASCSIIPGLETLHITFLIKSLTIPYACEEGRQIEGEEDVQYVSVKKKRGKGRESKKGQRRAPGWKKDEDKGRQRGRDHRPNYRMGATGKAEDR